MNIDIYIKERGGSREIRIPWLPEEIQYKSGDAALVSYDIMNRGEVAVPTGSGLATVSWESTFPGKNRTDSSMLRGSWKSPETYHKILEDWLENGASLNVMVTGYPINLDVVLKEYNAMPTGGFGDMDYEIVLLEERELTIGSKKADTGSSGGTQRSAETSTTYTVKSGDTLWKIAAMSQHYGQGSQWSKIYSANKEIIESTAKKRGKKSSDNGHWIWPGTVLSIVK